MSTSPDDADEPQHEIPDDESLNPEARISDEKWDELVELFHGPTATNSEVSADDVRDYLAENEDWEPPPAAPLGIRTARPATVLAWIGTLGSAVFLVLGAMFFRPIPGLAVLAALVIGAGSLGFLFYSLPRRRNDWDNGAEV